MGLGFSHSQAKISPPLVVGFLDVDGRTGVLLIPDDGVLLVERGTLVGDTNDLASVGNFLLGHSGGILRNPQHRSGSGGRRWPVGSGLGLGVDLVGAVASILGDELTEGVIVGVLPGLEPAQKDVSTFGVGGSNISLGSVGGVSSVASAGTVGTVGLGVAVLLSVTGDGGAVAIALLEETLLSGKAAREPVQERVQVLEQRNLEQDGEDEEHSHQHGRANGLGNSKQANHADLSQVDTNEQLL